MAAVRLKPGREKSLLRRHPWVFAGAIDGLEGTPGAGDTVAVCSAGDEVLGWGAFSPASQISVRLWSFGAGEPDWAEFWRSRLASAAEARRRLFERDDLDAYRLVNAESDGLPGVVVDRYGDFLVFQFLSAGAERWKAELVGAVRSLAQETPAAFGQATGLYERSDVDVRVKEGLAPVSGVLAGEAPPERIVVREGGTRFWVDPYHGHKTGFYLDQRDNRALTLEYARGAEVLNAFSYSGAFGVFALRGGAARVTNVDTSGEALGLATANILLNDLDPAKVESIHGDVFHVLRQFRDARRQFDLVILDPPKFADSRSQVEGAARGYKDINLLALKLLRPGGVLMTFSCSGLVGPDLFQKIVAGAALDSRRDVQILRRLSQAPDHPVRLNFPEGEYLKGLVCRVTT